MININNLKINYGKKIILETSLSIKQGVLTAIVGESGSGKSSLLNVLSLYNYDQSFEYLMNGLDLSKLSYEELCGLQKSCICYLPQHPQFIESMTCKENLLLECEISGCGNEDLVDDTLKRVKLINKKNVLPKKLSGGEKQRLAVACAIIKNAQIILCDEITSSLDDTNTRIIIDILKELAHGKGKTVIISSHEKKIIESCDEVFSIIEKKLVKIKSVTNLCSEKIDIVSSSPKKFKFKMAVSRMKKRKSLFLLLILVVSIVVSSLTYFLTWTNQRLNFMEHQLNSYLSNELFLMNNVSKNVVQYISHQPPFEDEFITELQNNELIDKIYPIYAFSAGMNGNDSKMIQVLIGDEIVTEKKLLFRNGRVGMENQIFPYFEENELKEISISTTNTTDGIYINHSFAQFLGLEELQDGVSISFDLNVPIAMKEVPCTIYYGGSGNEAVVVNESTPQLSYTGVLFVKETVNVILPISGILPESYNCLGIATTNLILAPNDLLNQYIEEYSKDYVLGKSEIPLTPNHFKVFFKEEADKNKVISSIEALSDDVSVLDAYEEYEQTKDVIDKTKKEFTISMFIVLVLALLLLLSYSLQHRKDIMMEDYYLNLHGITKKEKKIMSFIEMGLMTMLFIFISIIFTNLFILYGIGGFHIMNVVGYEINYLYVLLIDLSLSSLFAFICESTLLLEKH